MSDQDVKLRAVLRAAFRATHRYLFDGFADSAKAEARMTALAIAVEDAIHTLSDAERQDLLDVLGEEVLQMERRPT
jgi:hypothetical protein